MKKLDPFSVLSNGWPNDMDGATVRWTNEVVLIGSVPAAEAVEIQQIVEYRYGVASRVVRS